MKNKQSIDSSDLNVSTSLTNRGLLLHVHLDHTYCVPSASNEYLKPVNPDFYNLLDQVECNTDNVGSVAAKEESNDIAFGGSKPLGEVEFSKTDQNEQLDLTPTRKRRASESIEEKPHLTQQPSTYQFDFPQNTTCHICNKVFSTISFLQRHMQRVHSAVAGCVLPRSSAKSTLEKHKKCTKCAQPVQGSKFNHHNCAKRPRDGAKKNRQRSQSIDTADDVMQRYCTCVHCGARMKRAFLERHISLEHPRPSVVEESNDKQVDTQLRRSDSENQSETGSETLSGSDNDARDDIVSCYVCYAYVHKASFQRHMQQEHCQKETEANVRSYLASVSEETSSVEHVPFPLEMGFYASRSNPALQEVSDEGRPRFDSLSPDQGYESNGSYMLQRFLCEGSLKS